MSGAILLLPLSAFVALPSLLDSEETRISAFYITRRLITAFTTARYCSHNKAKSSFTANEMEGRSLQDDMTCSEDTNINLHRSSCKVPGILLRF